MENLKIKVSSEAESKEAQEFLFKLGYMWLSGAENPINLGSSYLYTGDDMGMWCGDFHATFNESNRKEITIQNLKDMVVLKRNSISDANYTYGEKRVLKLETMDYKIFDIKKECWVDHIGSQTDLRLGLKPIQKPEVKEFLEPMPNGDYRYYKDDGFMVGGDWLEIPEGTEVIRMNLEGSLNFYKKIDGHWAIKNKVDMINWYQPKPYSNHFDADDGSLPIVWQRHIQPKELPFIGEFTPTQELASEAMEVILKDEVKPKHDHYFKDISGIDKLDIYRVTELFNPHSCGAHIAKKALCSGKRGYKDLLNDIQDIIDTAERWKEMLIEDSK